MSKKYRNESRTYKAIPLLNKKNKSVHSTLNSLYNNTSDKVENTDSNVLGIKLLSKSPAFQNLKLGNRSSKNSNLKTFYNTNIKGVNMTARVSKPSSEVTSRITMDKIKSDYNFSITARKDQGRMTVTGFNDKYSMKMTRERSTPVITTKDSYMKNPNIWKGSLDNFNLKKKPFKDVEVPKFTVNNHRRPSIRDQDIITRYTMIRNNNSQMAKENQKKADKNEKKGKNYSLKDDPNLQNLSKAINFKSKDIENYLWKGSSSAIPSLELLKRRMLANHESLVNVPSSMVSTFDDLKDFREFCYENSKETCRAMLEFQTSFLVFVEKQMTTHSKLGQENEDLKAENERLKALLKESG
ncbi:unnamed protein product [Moneuplotes crassus]|uniref:Uncharacterized protein n=1 Tax=Euplotes crassus TaxID=5936 RepID=A0AAD2CVF1_EUPCR|nr:unnamed protein product [Moneuplotes crassus]